ncbi:MAG: stage 0 sporulation protein [Oligoflexia bacterium]|nr:stage 0 sporulation protein [Oligoflexia bacterium]
MSDNINVNSGSGNGIDANMETGTERDTDDGHLDDVDYEETEGEPFFDVEGDGEELSKFKEGQVLTFVRVRFPGNPKALPFYVGKRKVLYGQKVIAMSDRGVAVGYVNSFPYQVVYNKSLLPIRNIIKVASDQDLEKEAAVAARAREARVICEKYVDRLQLDMELTHVEYTQFGKKAVFYFTAPGRVDFRELVKLLVADLKMRIELRQIYVRDRPAAIGGLGPCGRQMCCNSFLDKYGYVNIKMAKNQNLTLSSNKLNGVCGQLKCCIQYEDDVYTQKKGKLPEVGQFIKTKNGDIGIVEKLHILCEQFEMLTDKGKRRRYVASQYDHNAGNPETIPSERLKFDTKFEYIADETFTVIGLDVN